jgi:hypothetical protein
MLAGIGIGAGFTKLTLPYLSRALAVSLGRVDIRQIVLDWPLVFGIYTILAFSFLIALGSSIQILKRMTNLFAMQQLEE